jgi:HD superfamily phosphohydrolase
MRRCLESLQRDHATCLTGDDMDALLAATPLHDIGHGPFSHATESFFGDHEERSVGLIASPDTEVHKILNEVNAELPGRVAVLIAKKEPPGTELPARWQKALISSQLDVDRLDFLGRDSLFSGAEYGNFDWYRIVHTMNLRTCADKPQKTHVFWPDKTKYAIEEYLFSRFYMYQSVYFHKTTRCYERLLKKILQRARELGEQSDQSFLAAVLPLLKPFFENRSSCPLEPFLDLTDYMLLAQMTQWRDSRDSILGDLAGRLFALRTGGFKLICDFSRTAPMVTKICEKENSAREYLRGKNLDPKYYLLTDEFGVSIYKPYVPEPETEERTMANVILISISGDGTDVQEMSNVLPRLQPIVKEPHTARYYGPEEHREELRKLLL